MDRHEEATELNEEATARRAFLKQAGKVAATAPAVALLLSAHATPALASRPYASGSTFKRGNCKFGQGQAASHNRRGASHARKGGSGGRRHRARHK